MISATRMLCQKYTDLTDAEISYLESYGALLPALANAEQADVFIDCRTVSGRSAIVVCEAKPQTVPSNYRSSILGMLIHWRDEPAVDRSFRLAVPTSGVRAVSMPEDRRIVQSVEPLFYEGRLIGVLIYERPALAAEEPPPAGEREAEQASGALDWAAVSPCLDDAVLFLDEEDRVCGFNPAATALYRRMGYIGTLAGMPVNNIQPAALSECDQDRHETALANRVLQYQRLPLSSGQARAALIIHDLTRQRQLEEELALQRTALQELRHRMKNNLQMLANLTRSRGCDPAESPPVQTALLDTANRLLSLAATLDGIVQVSREKVSLLQILEHPPVHAPDSSALRPPCHHPRGRRGRHSVSADCASSVALVVNELVQNALKYAFPSGQAGGLASSSTAGAPSASSPSGTTAWASRRTALAPEAPVWSWPPRSCGRSSPASGAWRAAPAGRGSPFDFWSRKTKSCADLRLWRRVQEHGRCSPGTAQALPLGCFA